MVDHDCGRSVLTAGGKVRGLAVEPEPFGMVLPSLVSRFFLKSPLV